MKCEHETQHRKRGTVQDFNNTRQHALSWPLNARSIALLGMLALAVVLTCTCATLSFADDEQGGTQESHSLSSSEKELYGDEKIEVDILADELKKALADSIMADVKAGIMKTHADIIAARIPEQQERSDKAARNLYKIQQNSYNILEMILSSQSLDEFIMQLDYFHDVTQNNVEEIKQAKELRATAKKDVKELKKTSADAEKKVDEARNALEEAQAVRIARAAQGIATSEQQAMTLGGESSVEKVTKTVRDKNGKKKTVTTTKKTIAATTDTSAIPDGADWSQSKEEFVAEWAPRLDAYLAGTPLANQGENFAKSAWKYNIDPRWSAAISRIESSNGQYCIRPHNAWGWGAADPHPYGLASEWGSWEEAIDAHSRGLSQGYGYTITIRGAKTYCPPNWQLWYNTTLDQMGQIRDAL